MEKIVLISDVHYSINTLSLANAAMEQAISYAEQRGLPLVVAGDLHDTKAILRAECVNAMIKTFKDRSTRIIIIPGNHCMLNEKGGEHSLGFLAPYVEVVSSFKYDDALGVYLVPYQTSPDAMRSILKYVPKASRLIVHQGIEGAYMGHYVQDKSALLKEDFSDYRTISGHFHRHQDVKCGPPRKGAVGLYSYIGSPYTMNFGEASDGPKGFCVLHDDGTLTQVPTNLRKHVVYEWNVQVDPDLLFIDILGPGDLLWIKAKGPASVLTKIDKKALGKKLIGHSNFKLDLIRDTEHTLEVSEKPRTEEELMDALIDGTSETSERKSTLKALWREVLDETP